jgi:hypothetical protein
MGYRPSDWTPLAPSDPVPGRPDDIRGEAGRLTQVADSIRDQITALHRVAAADKGGQLKGQYAGKISDTAGSLSDHLGRAENRYRVASGELGRWVTALETAQGESLTELSDAQQAQRDIEANTPHPTTSPGPSGQSPSQQSASQQPAAPDPAQQHALADAQHRLAAAKTALAKTVGTMNDAARTHAGNIRAACQSDGLKDSTWDKFKHWVDDHSRLISDICNVLGWIATICAVVALFIPGLNILAAIALGATLLSLIGHTMLASAGDGSWFDVALDAFALVTMGAGGLAAEGASAGERGLEAGLKGEAAIRAGDKAFGDAVEASPELSAAYKAVDDPAVGLSEKAFNWGKISEGFPAAAARRAAAKDAVTDLAENPASVEAGKPTLPNWSSLSFGDKAAAGTRAWAQGVSNTLSHDPEIVSRAAKLYSNLGTVGTTWRLGAGADVIDKSLGSVAPWRTGPSPWKPGFQGYYNLTRNPFYMPIGSAW